MKVIDMHCDTISRLYTEGRDMDLRHNTFHLDLEKMKQGDYLLQNFALFLDTDIVTDPPETALAYAGFYYHELNRHADLIRPVYSFEDIEKAQMEGKMCALLTLEEGDILCGELAALHDFYRLGVRMIALTWNHENTIGYPNLSFSPDGLPLFSARNNAGLKEKGIEIIREMERLGIIIDVSHLSDGGFWDVYHHTTRPFVASHSNAAAVCNVCRNLTDDMIRALGNRGGVTGINFCAAFLSSDQPVSRISDMIRHMRHITDVGGIEVCALGSDFDGIENDVECKDASGIQLLAEGMKKSGFSEDDIEKIFYKNVLRVYKEIL